MRGGYNKALLPQRPILPLFILLLSLLRPHKQDPLFLQMMEAMGGELNELDV